MNNYPSLFYEMHDEKIDKEKFIEEAKSWEYFPVVKDKKIIAFFVVKGNRIHCACFKEYRNKWFPMKLYLKIVRNIIRNYGKAVTTTYQDTKEFVERLGFKQVGINGNQFIYERCEE